MKTIRLSKNARVIGGVCSGIAECFGWNVNVVRLVFIATTLIGGIGLVLYPLLWILIALTDTADEPTGNRAVTLVNPSRLKLVSVTEIDRIEEPLTTETRTIDATRSKSNASRSITVTREWVVSCRISDKEINSATTQSTLSIASLGEMTRVAERELARHYQVEFSSRRAHSETVTVDVPAGSGVAIQIHWKQIWKKGLIRMTDDDNHVIDIPFQIADGITFDQELLEL